VGLIEKFLKQYSREFDLYRQTSKLTEERCEASLEENGIRAIVTSRAKRIDRCAEKARARNKKRKKKYKTVRGLFKDIVDLAGVRIALYFPGDADEVERLIKDRFDVIRSKVFPEKKRWQKGSPKQLYEKRFGGYGARHYLVRMKSKDLQPNMQRFAEVQVEIQVASVLMHGWAEVEHDLAYKPMSGKLSEEEFAVLDELNGLVLSGEIALQRLQWAVKRRLSQKDEKFGNHYELAAYIYDYFATRTKEPTMGRVDVLLRFLQKVGKDRPGDLDGYLKDCDQDTEKRPAVDQIVDRILSDNKALYRKYGEARIERGDRSPSRYPMSSAAATGEEKILGRFLSKWIQLEMMLRREVRRKLGTQKVLYPNASVFVKSLIPHRQTEYDFIRRLRNDVVHGSRILSPAELADSEEKLNRLIEELKEKTKP